MSSRTAGVPASRRCGRRAPGASRAERPMSEPEQQTVKELQLGELLAALKRRRKAALYTFLGGALATVLVALLLPAYYQATGVILIEQQAVPQELVHSVISSYADERVQTINQRVMTTQNLLDIIKRHNLYPERRR